MFYVVMEVQIDANGNKGIQHFDYDDYNVALNKLYTILAAASASTIPYHAGYIVDSSNTVTDGRVFDRRQ